MVTTFTRECLASGTALVGGTPCRDFCYERTASLLPGGPPRGKHTTSATHRLVAGRAGRSPADDRPAGSTPLRVPRRPVPVHNLDRSRCSASSERTIADRRTIRARHPAGNAQRWPVPPDWTGHRARPREWEPALPDHTISGRMPERTRQETTGRYGDSLRRADAPSVADRRATFAPATTCLTWWRGSRSGNVGAPPAAWLSPRPGPGRDARPCGI